MNCQILCDLSTASRSKENDMTTHQRITPFLSFTDQAAQAAQFYVSAIPNSRIIRQVLNPATQTVLIVEFELKGMNFMALNAGRDWKFTEALSLAIDCDSQAELDMIWKNLLDDGGTELACGWLRDKFGLCWQIWPTQLRGWMASDDTQAVQRMFEACWQMVKLDIATLQKAFEGDK
jgi:predicted 3-demethylubiquinone-9 3-methyltransferase (glyoxalase superfamily)